MWVSKRAPFMSELRSWVSYVSVADMGGVGGDDDIWTKHAGSVSSLVVVVVGDELVVE